MQHLEAVQASGNKVAAHKAFEDCQLAFAHAQQVSAEVVAALENLAAGMVEVNGPALARLEQTVLATQALLQQSKTAPGQA
jgi:hypothetical protein